MGTYTLPPLQCVHVGNVFPPASTVREIFGTYTFRFRVHATRTLFFFCYFRALLFLTGSG